MSALTRGLHALLAPLVLVAVLVAGLGGGWAPVAAVGLLDFVPGAPPFPPGDPQGLQDQRGAVTLEGKYKLAKVNVLGVPTITVASPIDESSSEVLGASIRARVIEGNLSLIHI